MIFATLLAGGIGKRMKSNKPKQFLKINNKPLLVYSVENFIKVSEIDKIIVTSPKKCLKYTEKLMKDYFPQEDRIVVIEGGKLRNDTIINSIKYIENNYTVDDNTMLITHDAARIFASPDLIKRSILETKNHVASSAVIPATDVIFKSKDSISINDIPDRKFLVHAQTPQNFKIKNFMEIYNKIEESEKKDLNEIMALFFKREEDLILFEGEFSNFKITNPMDLIIAETYINHK